MHYFKDLELHTIELTKFSNNSNEELDELLAKIKRTLDIWVTFLTRNDLINRENLPDKLDNPLLKKALHVLDVMSFGELELQAYEERLKWLRVEANTLKKYEAKAREEGQQIGLEKGKIAIARSMKVKGIPTSIIAECTCLSENAIKNL